MSRVTVGPDGRPASLPLDLVQYIYLFKGLPPYDAPPVDNFVPATTQKWARLLGLRGTLFFQFVKEFTLHVRLVYHRVYNTSVIPWCTIPGYSSILSALLYELARHSPTTHPAAVVERYVVVCNVRHPQATS